MLSENEISEIREYLQNASSPLFYFDNDQDGCSSYLLLRRFIGKGAGVPVKTSPLGMDYYRRVDEFNPDIVFILDQPTVSKEFFEKLESEGITVVWIDHHETNLDEIPSFVHYYNPIYSKESENVPVTAVCYDISGRHEDLWLAVVGCIADRYMPKFYSEFLEKYPDLGVLADDPFKVFYGSSIGKISRMIGTGLKDRTTNVVAMIKFLASVKTPYEVLEEGKDNHTMHRRFNDIDLKFRKLIERAKSEADDSNILIFKYSGETSMSADIANKLSYLYPEKNIIVAFVRGVRVNLSMRGHFIKEKALSAIEDLPHATCGGHDDAVGAQLDENQLDDFINKLKKKIDN